MKTTKLTYNEIVEQLAIMFAGDNLEHIKDLDDDGIAYYVQDNQLNTIAIDVIALMKDMKGK